MTMRAERFIKKGTEITNNYTDPQVFFNNIGRNILQQYWVNITEPQVFGSSCMYIYANLLFDKMVIFIRSPISSDKKH